MFMKENLNNHISEDSLTACMHRTFKQCEHALKKSYVMTFLLLRKIIDWSRLSSI